MQYMLLIYESEKAFYALSEEDQGKIFEEYGAFTKELDATGKNKGSEALLPTNTATTIRVRDGKVTRTDGPFAETREQLGGFYLVEAKDMEAAIAIARRIPTAKTGSVEVREVVVFG